MNADQERDQLRVRIDLIDRDLVTLLARRQYVTDAMVAFKQPGAVRDDQRIASVIANVRRASAALDLSPDLVERLWRQVMEASALRQEERLKV